MQATAGQPAAHWTQPDNYVPCWLTTQAGQTQGVHCSLQHLLTVSSVILLRTTSKGYSSTQLKVPASPAAANVRL
jgi:hypothetical protein